MNPSRDIDSLVEKIANSRKYRDAGIPKQTIQDILAREMARFPKDADALHSARAILHNVMAPYLGETDYAAEQKQLVSIAAGNRKSEVDAFCRALLMAHDSTRERMPYLADFYAAIREIAGNPKIIIDLACAHNPFALPFMGLPASVEYHAYDIHQPRVELINAFFASQGLEPLAENRDVLLDPPQISADAAFLFKEAHRMEKRRTGSSRIIVHSLNARVIFISLPNRSLDGQRDLHQRMDALFSRIRSGMGSASGSREFPGEMLYWIEKKDG